MEWIRNSKGKSLQLKYKGELTVNEASSVKDSLSEEFHDIEDLSLDLGEVSSCDTFGIQLLCAASKTAADANIRFSVSSFSGVIRETAALIGFDLESIAEKG